MKLSTPCPVDPQMKCCASCCTQAGSINAESHATHPCNVENWARSAIALCSSAEVPTRHCNLDESIRCDNLAFVSMDTKPLCPFETELRTKN